MSIKESITIQRKLTYMNDFYDVHKLITDGCFFKEGFFADCSVVLNLNCRIKH